MTAVCLMTSLIAHIMARKEKLLSGRPSTRRDLRVSSNRIHESIFKDGLCE